MKTNLAYVNPEPTSAMPRTRTDVTRLGASADGNHPANTGRILSSPASL